MLFLAPTATTESRSFGTVQRDPGFWQLPLDWWSPGVRP